MKYHPLSPCPHLDDRVVDIDGRHGELVLLGELVEAVYSSDALLHDASHVLRHTGELAEQAVRGVTSVVQQDVGLPGVCTTTDTLVDAPPEFSLCLARPGEDGVTWGAKGGGGEGGREGGRRGGREVS